MYSNKGAKLLEESTDERFYGSTSNSGPSTEPKTKSKHEKPDLSSSAPPVLEPSKDPSRPSQSFNQNTFDDSSSPPINPWRTLVTCSCPESSITVPIRSDDPTDGNADKPQMDGHLTTCSSLVHVYKNTAMTIRNSCFIHIFQILFSVIPISAMVMGVLFEGKCKAYGLLPTFCGLAGFIGTIFTGIWISISCFHRLGRTIADMHQLICIVFFLVYSFTVIMDMSVFGTMSCSFDEKATHYCHKTFYYYLFYKHIATGAIAIVAMLLYLPGSLHFIQCHCFTGDGICI